MGGRDQILTFAYMVGGWVWENAYVIKKSSEKMIFWKKKPLKVRKKMITARGNVLTNIFVNWDNL